MEFRSAMEAAVGAMIVLGCAIVIPRTVLRNKRREGAEVAARILRERKRTSTGSATVTKSTATGWTINDMPQFEVELELTVEDRVVRFQKKVLAAEGTTIDAGDELTVKYDPLDPNNVDTLWS